ncbi:hypothetical protein F5Y15DRAFT_277236 [Xylariaceae sp. FL0016]|nr:hypothetical protein F5Y15DRAFT_277236 [Xylariaceae sp. FL0016]
MLAPTSNSTNLPAPQSLRAKSVIKQQEIPKTLRLTPLPTTVNEQGRGLPIVMMTPDQPVPCRRCLQDSRVGEEMVLISYDPFRGDSPHRCTSPIFLHPSSRCHLASFPSTGALLPEQQRTRFLSVRAFDAGHMMVGSDLVDGEQMLDACERLLGDETRAEYCHLHYARQGCFAVRVDKVKVDG